MTGLPDCENSFKIGLTVAALRVIDGQTHGRTDSYDGKARATQSVERVVMPTKEQRGLGRPKLAQM